MGVCIFKRKEEKLEEIPKDFFALQAKDINEEIIPMSKYQEHKLILIVNVACKCAMYSSSYKNLKTYKRNFDNISEKFDTIKNYIIRTGLERLKLLNQNTYEI